MDLNAIGPIESVVLAAGVTTIGVLIVRFGRRVAYTLRHDR